MSSFMASIALRYSRRYSNTRLSTDLPSSKAPLQTTNFRRSRPVRRFGKRVLPRDYPITFQSATSPGDGANSPRSTRPTNSVSRALTGAATPIFAPSLAIIPFR